MSKLNLNGLLVPFVNNNPAIIQAGDTKIIPAFTTQEKFVSAVEWAVIKDARCNVISDGQQFLEALKQLKKEVDVVLAIDPYITEDGNTRFLLVKF